MVGTAGSICLARRYGFIFYSSIISSMPQIKVTISPNVEELLALAEIIYQKHQALGKASPLAVLDWQAQGPRIAQALAAHKRAEELKRLMEQAYEQRDALLEPVDAIVRQSRDVLKGIYRNEPRKIGEFGFNVVAPPRSKKTETV